MLQRINRQLTQQVRGYTDWVMTPADGCQILLLPQTPPMSVMKMGSSNNVEQNLFSLLLIVLYGFKSCPNCRLIVGISSIKQQFFQLVISIQIKNNKPPDWNS